MDTSALIDLWRHYPRDVFPGLWRNLERLLTEGKLVAPHRVLKELEQKDDDLSKWAKRNRRMFVGLDMDQQQQVKKLLEKYPALVDPGKSIPEADPFVVALGKKGYIVISQERRGGPGSVTRIPDVCEKEGITCISLHQLFREERWEF